MHTKIEEGGDKKTGATIVQIDDICSKDMGYLRIRGLPFDCTLKDIASFFDDYELSG